MSRKRMPESVAAAVIDRDHGRCTRCGRPGSNLHHRQGRGGNDPHRLSNVIVLCGTGSTGCHGWVHEHPAEAYRLGLMVHRNWRASTEETPVTAWYGTALLTDDGLIDFNTE